jgi:TonB-dependent receptor
MKPPNSSAMSNKLLVFLFSSFLLISAASAQNGIIRGSIQDQQSDERLSGATISINEGNYGTAANLQGNFTLNLPADTYELKIRYLGYRDTTVQVQVESGKTTNFDIRLQSSSMELSGLTIQGMLQGQAQALNQQKSADNIKNIVAADQIGRFPDPNAAEALQRIPGVNIERDQGEGRYVLVRGLAPQFTNISVNGEQIPSPEADVRFVALDAIPSDQLSSLEVTKALTPDMDGDAIGGNVNLVTRVAESSEPTFRGSLVGGYNNLMQRPNLQGSAQYGQRFGERDQLGILLNTSFYHNDLGSDNWEREPFDNELELRDYELTRTRLGLSSSFDYAFSPNHEVYLRTLFTRFTDREWRRRYVFIPEDEEIEKLTKDRFEAQSVASVNLGARHTLPGISIDYELQYSYGEQDTPYDYEGAFLAGIPSTLNFSNPDYASFEAPGYLDNSNYEFDALEVGNTLAKDQNLTAKINFSLPYSESRGMVKFGGKLRLKNKSFTITQEVYEARADIPTLDNFTGGLLDDNFLGGQYQFSPFAELGRFLGYFNSNLERFELQVEDKAIDEALEAFDATENVYAAYLMTKYQFDRLTLLGGLRYEYTDVSYESRDVIIAPNGDLQAILSADGTSDYDFLLPQLHLKYELDDYTNLRGALTYSYARPNFIEIVPSQEANLEDNEATVGNPELLPVSAMNIDLLAERYFGNVGIISGGFFYKQLDNFIYPRVLFNSQYPLQGTPRATGIRVTQSQNGGQADLLGFELAIQRNLDFLPGFLSGLIFYGNYTYTYSEANIQSRDANETNPNVEESLRLPGQATNVGNLALGYDKGRVSGRIAANFNGEYLSEVGAAPQEDVFVADRLQLDANINYSLNKQVQFFAEFLNLTNQPFEVYQGDESTTIQREFYSWWSRVGIKINL